MPSVLAATDPGPDSAFASDGGELDLVRMRRERLAKLQAAMRTAGFDALVLAANSSVRYATGTAMMNVEISRNAYEPTIAVVLPDAAPHVFTPYPEGAPLDIPRGNVHAPLLVEFEEGVEVLAGALTDLLGAGEWRVGFDDLSGAELERLPVLLPHLTIGDAGEALVPAKLFKTSDEVECLRRAQRINELAMYDVMPALRPGVTQSELSGIFLRRIFELGASGNVIDPIWSVTAASIAQGPFTVNGDVAFPLCSSNAILRQDDLIMCDTGILYEGYASDFGRTWIVGNEPTRRQKDQFRRWKDVIARVLAVTRPGATGLDLMRAAREPEHERPPVFDHFYLVHGIGTDSAEMPFIGTDFGDEFDESIVLQPGMIMVLEPVIWDDGEGGYRAEETVVVTDDGFRSLCRFPYTPFEEGTVSW